MKNLLIIPSALFPYVVIALLCAVFGATYITDTVPALDNSYYMLFILLILAFAILISLVTSIGLTVFTVCGKANPLSVAKTVMIAKLVQIPAYIVIFLFCLIGFSNIFLLAFVVVLAFLDCITIFMTALPNAAVAFDSARKSKMTKEKAILLGILQFVFVADIIASIVLYKTLKHV
ncbi:MAG: hypothetical protein IJ002_06830 [Clostridia bacterium]|nr:hypothetical protein [Clostridia bacterium]